MKIWHKDVSTMRSVKLRKKKDQRKNKPYRGTLDEPIGTIKDKKFIKGKKLA